MSCIHFKFKSSLDYDKLVFDGLQISLVDLREAIMKQKKIGLSNEYKLEIVDAQSKKLYKNDSETIPRNTSVIVRRVPIPNAPKLPKTQHKDPSLLPQAAMTEQKQRLTSDDLRKTGDLASANASEEDKVRAMMSQSAEGFDPSQYSKLPMSHSQSPVVPPGLLRNAPPPSYVCYRCGQKGHWIKLCPTNGDPSYDNYRYRRPQGIPSSQTTIVGPGVPGTMMDKRGNLVARTVDVNAMQHASKRGKVRQDAAVTAKEMEIPPELVCSICKELVRDAVIIPCCGESFCDECIREHLLENEFTCPACSETDVSPDSLAPNKALRTSAKTFQSKVAEEKSVSVARGFVRTAPVFTSHQAIMGMRHGISKPASSKPASLPSLRNIMSAKLQPSQAPTLTSSQVTDSTPPTGSVAASSSMATSIATTTTSSTVAIATKTSPNSSQESKVTESDSQSSQGSVAEKEASIESKEESVSSLGVSHGSPPPPSSSSSSSSSSSTLVTAAKLAVPETATTASMRRSRSPSPSPSTIATKEKTSEKMATTSAASTTFPTAPSLPFPPALAGHLPMKVDPALLSAARLLGAPPTTLPSSILAGQLPPLVAPTAPLLPGMVRPVGVGLGMGLPLTGQAAVTMQLGPPQLGVPLGLPSAGLPAVAGLPMMPSADSSKLERFASELLSGANSTTKRPPTPPIPLSAEEFYRQQQMLRMLRPSGSGSSTGSRSRSSHSRSRSSSTDSISQNSQSDSWSRSRSRSRSYSRSHSPSLSPYRRSRRQTHNRHKHNRTRHRHEHDRRERERERTRGREKERTGGRSRHLKRKRRRHESPEVRSKRSRKSRSRSPREFERSREPSPELASLEVAAPPEGTDHHSHRHGKHRKNKKAKRKHRHLAVEERGVSEETGAKVKSDLVGGPTDLDEAGVSGAVAMVTGDGELAGSGEGSKEGSVSDRPMTEDVERVRDSRGSESASPSVVKPEQESNEAELKLEKERTASLTKTDATSVPTPPPGDKTPPTSSVSLVPYQDSPTTEPEGDLQKSDITDRPELEEETDKNARPPLSDKRLKSEDTDLASDDQLLQSLEEDCGDEIALHTDETIDGGLSDIDLDLEGASRKRRRKRGRKVKGGKVEDEMEDGELSESGEEEQEEEEEEEEGEVEGERKPGESSDETKPVENSSVGLTDPALSDHEPGTTCSDGGSPSSATPSEDKNKVLASSEAVVDRVEEMDEEKKVVSSTVRVVVEPSAKDNHRSKIKGSHRKRKKEKLKEKERETSREERVRAKEKAREKAREEREIRRREKHRRREERMREKERLLAKLAKLKEREKRRSKKHRKSSKGEKSRH